ncbi:hypothetical protein Drorol1_Dr00007511 [Drosera rotundifolia]
MQSKKSLSCVAARSGFRGGVLVTKCSASKEQLKSAKEDIKELLRTQFCHPILYGVGVCSWKLVLSWFEVELDVVRVWRNGYVQPWCWIDNPCMMVSFLMNLGLAGLNKAELFG